MTATVPCSFRWFTIRNGVTTEAQQFKGNTYICEPADVGCMLQVEITVMILLSLEFRSIMSWDCVNVIRTCKVWCIAEKRNINRFVNRWIMFLCWSWLRQPKTIMSTKSNRIKNNSLTHEYLSNFCIQLQYDRTKIVSYS